MENESQVWNQSTPQPLANTTSYNYPSENEYVRLFGDSDGYWIFSTNDIPILIGAVAGMATRKYLLSEFQSLMNSFLMYRCHRTPAHYSCSCCYLALLSVRFAAGEKHL